jgi:uncharacterized protein YndB with AHSA1/START domain
MPVGKCQCDTFKVMIISSLAQPDISDRSFTLTVEHTFNLPARIIYKAWTEEFGKWFASPRSVLMHPEVDSPFFFETEYKFETKQPASRHPHYGRFLKLDQNKLIEMAWITGKGGTEGAETIVTVELTSTEGGTHLRLTHSGFNTSSSRDGHAKAWPEVLQHLEEVYAHPK